MNTMRKPSLILSCLFLVFTACTRPKAVNDRPNIVVIIVDDLGWADLGVYGNTYFESPHLDKLAKKGMRFTRAYAGSHVCSPTRASLFTGRNPARVGLTNYLYGTKEDENSSVMSATYMDHLPLKEITIAEELKKDGYKTGLIGKWHLGENTTFGMSDPIFQGFDVTEGFDYELLPVDKTYKWYKIGNQENAYELPYLTDEITKNSIKFIEENKDSTFFLTVAHFAVHLPLQGEALLVDKYTNKINPRPEDYHPVYGAMIEQMDQSVGKIIQSLEDNELMENTIVIFVSDNGGLAVGEAGDKPTVNTPLRAGKGTMYEGGIRVPMIAFWKNKFDGGYINESTISTTDIFPTLLNIVRGTDEVSQVIDGENRLEAFQTRDKIERKALYFHYPHFSNQGGRPTAAIIEENFKLIKSLETGETELFDLHKDQEESTDLSKVMPELSRRLSEKIDTWQQNVNAPMPRTKK